VLKRFFLFTAAAALSVAPPAAAQTITSPYEFVERRQGLFAYGTHVLTDRGTIKVGPHSATGAGLGYAIRLSGPFTFDTRLAVLPTRRTVYDRRDDQHDPEAIAQDPMVGLVEVGTADLSLLLADVSLRFDITGPRTWYKIQPYALLGAGGVFPFAAEHDAEAALPAESDLRVRFSNGVTGHFGGGLEYFLTDRLTGRLDARNVLWRLNIPSGFITSARVIDDREWLMTAHLSLGLGYRF
jgi:hypothetical protein